MLSHDFMGPRLKQSASADMGPQGHRNFPERLGGNCAGLMWGNDDTGKRVRAGADDDDSRRFQWVQHFLGARQATLRRQPLHLPRGCQRCRRYMCVRVGAAKRRVPLAA